MRLSRCCTALLPEGTIALCLICIPSPVRIKLLPIRWTLPQTAANLCGLSRGPPGTWSYASVISATVAARICGCRVKVPRGSLSFGTSPQRCAIGRASTPQIYGAEMAYQKKNDVKAGRRQRREYYISIPTRNGGRVQRSSRTSKKKVAECYEAMFVVLSTRSEQDRVLIDRVIAGTLRIEELYHNYKEGTLQKLAPPSVEDASASLDLDLEPLVAEWEVKVRSLVEPNTAVSYIAAVRDLIPKGTPFPKSEFTSSRLSSWLDHMTGKASAKQYRWSGLHHFIRSLIRLKHLTENPASGIKRPPLPPPRDAHMDSDEVMRLADAMPSPFREVIIFLNGTGAEVTPGLAVRRRDVNRKTREVMIRGTKNKYRKRMVRIAEWAWPTVEALIANKQSNDRLFDPQLVNRRNLLRVHTATLTRLIADGVLDEFHTGYTPRDARHTFAVRLVRAGVPLHLVAAQLGHKDARMVSEVYGKYQPKQKERNIWELVARKYELDSSEERGDLESEFPTRDA